MNSNYFFSGEFGESNVGVASEIGAKMGKIIRMVRLIRLLRLSKALEKQSKTQTNESNYKDVRKVIFLNEREDLKASVKKQLGITQQTTSITHQVANKDAGLDNPQIISKKNGILKHKILNPEKY